MHLSSHAATIAAVNIPSFMGGKANPWVDAAGHVALANPYKKSAEKGYNSAKKIEKQLNFQPQDPTDGMLEFVTFPNLWSLAVIRRGNRAL